MKISSPNLVILEDQNEIANRGESDFRALEGKTVLISGGTGFVGKWILRGFLGATELFGINIQIIVITRNVLKFQTGNPEFEKLNIRFIESDIGKLDINLDLGSKIDLVIHAATDAATNPISHEIDQVLNTGVHGSLNIARLSINNGCHRILNLSSGAIYGQQPLNHAKLSEDYQGAPNSLDPNTAYHHVKRLSEYLIHSEGIRNHSEVITARLFAFLGPYLPRESYFAAGNFLEDVRRKKQIEIQGDGLPIRTYQYPVDLVVALMALALRGKPGNAYNVGSDEQISIFELAKRISELSGSNTQPVVHGASQTNLAGSRYVPDISKIAMDVNFKNQHNIDSSISRTLKWLSTITE